MLARAARYRDAAEADPHDVQAIAVAGPPAVARAEPGDGGPADLNTAVRLTFPAACRTLHPGAMAGGRPPEPVDARIYDDLVWVLR